MPDSTLKRAPEAGGGRVAGALENVADNFSPSPWSDRSKWLKLDWLRRESVIRRQRTCMAAAWDAFVRVRKGGDTVGYSGVISCGRRSCPVCGPRLAANNRDEIVQAVRAWREGEGGRVYFGTFTVRHRLGQSFEQLAAGVAAGWHRVTSGKGWVADRRRHGVEHWIRVFEEKWSPSTGWHLHIHYLVFVASAADVPGALPIEHLLKSMFRRWHAGVVSQGLDAPELVGQDLHEVEGDGSEVLGDYFVKEAMGTAQRTAQEIGFELTNRDGKFSRSTIGLGSLTPGEILTMAVAGHEESRLLWNEYEAGMHKRRVIAFSKGLRARVGIGDELPPEEIAQRDAVEEMFTFLEMRGQMYRKLVSFGHRTELLAKSMRLPVDDVIAWLAEWGIEAVSGTYDTQGGDCNGESNSPHEPSQGRALDDALSLLTLPY